MPAVAVGISVDRQHGFHPSRHIGKLFRIPHTVGILCKGSLQTGDISHIDIRQNIGDICSVFLMISIFGFVQFIGLIGIIGQVNGQIRAGIGGIGGDHLVGKFVRKLLMPVLGIQGNVCRRQTAGITVYDIL